MKLTPLILIEVVAFLLIIGETYLFFEVVVPLGPLPHNLFEFTVFGLAKLVLIAGLGALWFLVMLGLTRLYVRSKVESPTPRPSS
jgi:hypothetical protein